MPSYQLLQSTWWSFSQDTLWKSRAWTYIQKLENFAESAFRTLKYLHTQNQNCYVTYCINFVWYIVSIHKILCNIVWISKRWMEDGSNLFNHRNIIWSNKGGYNLEDITAFHGWVLTLQQSQVPLSRHVSPDPPPPSWTLSLQEILQPTRLQNVFFWMASCICPNHEMYLSSMEEMFGQVWL